MPNSPHILIVDDDREIRSLLSKFLTQHGFRVSAAADGRAMMEVLDGAKIDLVVLDIMLTGEDGLSLCRKLRATSEVPIIMLTALSEETDRIVGLELGADDYVTKPFNPRELMARAKAILRRTGGAPDADEPGDEAIYEFEGWRFDIAKRSLTSPDQIDVQLSGGEFQMLVAFVQHPRRVLSRDQLLDLARGRASVPFDRSIDVQVSRLRRKIEPDPKQPTLIKTVRTGGYTFTPAVTRSPARKT
ncbi:MAG: response regulator [Alphaproteobacteria bacterium]